MSINPAKKTYGNLSFKTICDECGKARQARAASIGVKP